MRFENFLLVFSIYILEDLYRFVEVMTNMKFLYTELVNLLTQYIETTRVTLNYVLGSVITLLSNLF